MAELELASRGKRLICQLSSSIPELSTTAKFFIRNFKFEVRLKLGGAMPRPRASQPQGQDVPRNVVGSQVRILRRAQRLMQKDLCARCQVLGFDLSRESLAKIESGFRVVSDTEVVFLAWALRVPLLTLFPEEHKLVMALRVPLPH